MRLFARVVLLLTLLPGVRAVGLGQSMVPAITQTQESIRQAERDGDVVDAAVYDYLARDKNATSTYDFYFYSSDSYTIKAFGDEMRNSNLTIRVLRNVNGSWTSVKQSAYTGKAYALAPFKPEKSERYRIEVSGVLAGGYQSTPFGLLIIRDEQ